MSYELIMEYYQQVQARYFQTIIFQEYGIIGLFLNYYYQPYNSNTNRNFNISITNRGEKYFSCSTVNSHCLVIGGILNYFIGFGGNKLFKKIKKRI